jgi:hypothetical protein
LPSGNKESLKSGSDTLTKRDHPSDQRGASLVCNLVAMLTLPVGKHAAHPLREPRNFVFQQQSSTPVNRWSCKKLPRRKTTLCYLLTYSNSVSEHFGRLSYRSILAGEKKIASTRQPAIGSDFVLGSEQGEKFGKTGTTGFFSILLKNHRR